MSYKILSSLDFDLKTEFADLDCTITYIRDGLHAFERLLKERYDFILISKQMEHLDGVSLIHSLRAIKTPNDESHFFILGVTEDLGLKNCHIFAENDFKTMLNEIRGHTGEETKGDDIALKQKGFPFGNKKLRKVLFIDDDEKTCELVKVGLKRASHVTYQTCTSGAEGFEILKSFEADLIVLDVMMPNMSGIDFIKKLREEKNDLPVIFMTAKWQVGELEKLVDLGPMGILLKPFKFATLFWEIQDIWNRGSL
jgi:DNA-binding response OmpR family regulator